MITLARYAYCDATSLLMEDLMVIPVQIYSLHFRHNLDHEINPITDVTKSAIMVVVLSLLNGFKNSVTIETYHCNQ